MRVTSIFGARLPLAFSGALVSRATPQSISTGATTSVEWEDEEYDIGGWFASSGDAVFTVPAGVSRVRLSAGISWSSAAGVVRVAFFEKNGVSAPGLARDLKPAFATTHFLVSAVLEVVPGDTLRARVFHDAGVSIDITAVDTTYFGVEAVR